VLIRIRTHRKMPSAVRTHKLCPPSPRGCQTTLVIAVGLEGENVNRSISMDRHLISPPPLDQPDLGRMTTTRRFRPMTASRRLVGLSRIVWIAKSRWDDVRVCCVSMS
jgi:hypothetical protein